jgi:hypothetical protein
MSQTLLLGRKLNDDIVLPFAVDASGFLLVSSDSPIYLISLQDVSLNGLTNRQVLMYDTPTSLWKNQQVQYSDIGNIPAKEFRTYAINGRLLSTRVDDLTEFSILTTGNWTTYSTTNNPSTGTLVLSAPNSTVDLNSSKIYRVLYQVAVTAPDISVSTNTWIARIRQTGISGTILREAIQANRIDNGSVALACDHIVTGVSTLYFSLQMTAGAYVNTPNDCTVSLVVCEI